MALMKTIRDNSNYREEVEFLYVTDWEEPAHLMTTQRGVERYGDWCAARVKEWNGKGWAGRMYLLAESSDGYVCVELAKRVRKTTRTHWANGYGGGRLDEHGP